MTIEDELQDESNERFRRQSLMDWIKENITGNYAGEPEITPVSNLFDVLNSLGTLPQKLMDNELLTLIGYISPSIATSHYVRRHLLLSAGQVSAYIYFLKKGLVRGFYTHKNTVKDITEFLWEERSIITVPTSFFQQQPSELFIEVMPGTELMSISFNDLMSCIQKYPVVEIFSRNVILQYNAYEAKRNYQLTFLSAWERYLELLKTHPGIEQQVTKEIIASYLHITPQSLSRILKERRHP